MSSAGLHAPRNKPEIEKQRDRKNRKKERHGDRSSDGAKEFLINTAWAYILSYKVVILRKTKITIPDLKHKMIPIKERVANNHLLPFGS